MAERGRLGGAAHRKLACVLLGVDDPAARPPWTVSPTIIERRLRRQESFLLRQSDKQESELPSALALLERWT